MDRAQRTAAFAPLILVPTMIAMFQALAGLLGDDAAWYVGLALYWLIWGVAYPWLWIGPAAVRAVLRPSPPTSATLALVSFPIAVVVIGRFVAAASFDRTGTWTPLLLLVTALGNGLFEEIGWRGVYLELFPNSIARQMLWPSLWFALWHIAPGSVAPDGNLFVLVAASLPFGLLLSYLARRTQTIWWPVVVHVVAGIILVV